MRFAVPAGSINRQVVPEGAKSLGDHLAQSVDTTGQIEHAAAMFAIEIVVMGLPCPFVARRLARYNHSIDLTRC